MLAKRQETQSEGEGASLTAIPMEAPSSVQASLPAATPVVETTVTGTLPLPTMTDVVKQVRLNTRPWLPRRWKSLARPQIWYL